jgi:hypothetical protein
MSIVSARRRDRICAPPQNFSQLSLGVPEFSDGYGELAADDIDGVNSPFARAFVRKVLGREVRPLFAYVREDVVEATNKRPPLHARFAARKARLLLRCPEIGAAGNKEQRIKGQTRYLHR